MVSGEWSELLGVHLQRCFNNLFHFARYAIVTALTDDDTSTRPISIAIDAAGALAGCGCTYIQGLHHY